MPTGRIPVKTVQPGRADRKVFGRRRAPRRTARLDLVPPRRLYFLAAQESATTQPTNVQPKTVLTTAIDAILRLSRWYAMTVGSMYQNTNNMLSLIHIS